MYRCITTLNYLVASKRTYLLALRWTGKPRPLAAPHPRGRAAFGQSKGLVHGVVRGGAIPVVEPVGGGRDAVGGALIEPPVFVAIVSARMLGS